MTEKIDPNGDVILAIGAEETCTRFRVSSTYLSNASAPFKAMLCGNFAEGQHNNQLSSYRIVPLPEDDVGSMRIILQVIHHQNEAAPTTLDHTRLLTLARAVDKWDLATTMRFAFLAWFPACDVDSLEACAAVFAAAYLVKDGIAFRRVTRVLAMEQVWSMKELLAKIEKNLMPLSRLCRAIFLMDDQRNEAFKLLELGIRSYANSCCVSPTFCGVRNSVYCNIRAFLVKKLTRNAFPGCAQVPLRDALEFMREYNVQKLTGNNCGQPNNHLSVMQMEQGMFDATDAADVACRGLCLVCLRETNDAPDVCVALLHPRA